jgi:type IV pilus assembly protein PilN
VIRVNLLPEELKKVSYLQKRKRQPKVPFFVIVALILLLAVSSGSYYMYITTEDELMNLSSKFSENDKQIRKLRGRLKELKDIERLEMSVKEKIDAIKGLRSHQSTPVILLSELSRRLPDGVWLTLLMLKGSRVSIEGDAFSNYKVVKYINSLKSSDFFRSVSLSKSERTVINENIAVYRFRAELQVGM